MDTKYNPIMETINQILAVCRCFETDHYSYTGCG